MGKSNAKPRRQCVTAVQHKAHTWVRIEDVDAERYWCSGVVSGKTGHLHIWENLETPILRETESAFLLETVLWDGPLECSCGMSRWMKDGFYANGDADEEVRFPLGDTLQRIRALRYKFESGEEITEADKAEILTIANALQKAFEPLMQAFSKMAELVGEAMISFADYLPPETRSNLDELGKAYGEKPDKIEVIDLLDWQGDKVGTALANPFVPKSARSVVGLYETDLYSFEAVGVEEEFWDDRTTPLAYSRQDSDRDLADRREAINAYNEVFAEGFPTHPWFTPEVIQQTKDDIDKQKS